MPVSERSIEERIKRQALDLGFCLVGIANAAPPDRFDLFRAWLDQGYEGELAYMRRYGEARADPEHVMPGVRSVIMVGLVDDPKARSDSDFVEATVPEFPHGEAAGKVARFARGPDYHEAIWRRLDRLRDLLDREVPGCRTRATADTAPLLERDFARRAGLGWVGKNTMLIDKRRGSYILLGAVLTDVELQPDPPHVADHCGTCTACLEACPTDAFPAPGVLDARRCISYLNIELRGSIPTEFREGIGDWLFGCDICQEVCPWNRHAEGGTESVDCLAALRMSEEEFRRAFRDTAVYRAKRRGLARNAAIVLGNTAGPDALTALAESLQDPDEAVRDAAAWAIEQINARSCGDVHGPALARRSGQRVEDT